MGVNQQQKQVTPVLVLGLPRTGTMSTRTAFLELGYPQVYHMITVLAEHPETAQTWDALMQRKYQEKKPIDLATLESLIRGYDVLSDYPPAAFAAELIQLFPDAKVVLTKRDPEGWVKSIKSTIMIGIDAPTLPNLVAFVNPTYRRIWGLFQTLATKVFPKPFVPNGVKFYEQHNAEVRSLMASAPDRFLEFDARQGWGPLCAFLGKPVPETPFPRVNDSGSFKNNFRMMLFMYFIRGVTRYAIVGACAGLTFAVWKYGVGFMGQRLS